MQQPTSAPCPSGHLPLPRPRHPCMAALEYLRTSVTPGLVESDQDLELPTDGHVGSEGESTPAATVTQALLSRQSVSLEHCGTTAQRSTAAHLWTVSSIHIRQIPTFVWYNSPLSPLSCIWLCIWSLQYRYVCRRPRHLVAPPPTELPWPRRKLSCNRGRLVNGARVVSVDVLLCVCTNCRLPAVLEHGLVVTT